MPTRVSVHLLQISNHPTNNQNSTSFSIYRFSAMIMYLQRTTPMGPGLQFKYSPGVQKLINWLAGANCYGILLLARLDMASQVKKLIVSTRLCEASGRICRQQCLAHTLVMAGESGQHPKIGFYMLPLELLLPLCKSSLTTISLLYPTLKTGTIQ